MVDPIHQSWSVLLGVESNPLRRRRPSPKPSARVPFGSGLIDTAVKGWHACETEFSGSQHSMNDTPGRKFTFQQSQLFWSRPTAP